MVVLWILGLGQVCVYVSFGGLGAKREEGTLAASCVKARGFGQDLGTSSFEI